MWTAGTGGCFMGEKSAMVPWCHGHFLHRTLGQGLMYPVDSKNQKRGVPELKKTRCNWQLHMSCWNYLDDNLLPFGQSNPLTMFISGIVSVILIIVFLRVLRFNHPVHIWTFPSWQASAEANWKQRVARQAQAAPTWTLFVFWSPEISGHATR